MVPKIKRTDLDGCLVIEPRVFEDSRGAFFELFNSDCENRLGARNFRQANVSKSHAGVLRGLHLQVPHGQGKLVTVLHGSAWDVAVDVRKDSPQFGQWTGVFLDASNRRQFWIPRGFAHGFLSLQDDTVFHYLCDETYHPESELSVRWNDPELAIDWPVKDVILSAKDANAPLLSDIPVERLPSMQDAPA